MDTYVKKKVLYQEIALKVKEKKSKSLKMVSSYFQIQEMTNSNKNVIKYCDIFFGIMVIPIVDAKYKQCRENTI